MGVHGLWDLLAPVGRRVSVETLAGKKLAIDASIWMVQFMKAMRDEKGEMVRNAHLIGFFRRICKLLYLKTKPVFVFDGGTPALKRRTVIARRRQRENAQAKIRKTAEKLLINHLKAMRLKELAKDLENQRQMQNNASKVKILPDQIAHMGSNLVRDDAVLASGNKGNIDESLPESIVAERDESLGRNASTSGNPIEEDSDEDEEMILPTIDGNVDPAVLAALPPSMQHSLLVRKHDAKGKKILSDDLDQVDTVGTNAEGNHVSLKSYDREKLDEMLAASIVAEEHGSLANNIAASAASFPCVEEDEDEDEEMILPAIHGNVDPAVLAALPPSMQLDLLVQMRERLMAENRQKYQRVRKAPEKFSELQIQAYLKTVAFRREIDEVQKAAAGRGIGGIQTSRIASEANREFIFSSSFTGDKQVLASGKVRGSGDDQQQTALKHSSNSLDTMVTVPSTSKSAAVTGLAAEETGAVFDDNVETYLDERGRVRVSRVRAMGIRMTRDLQRNLDMMREIEHEGIGTNNIADAESMPDLNKVRALKSFSRKSKFVEASQDGNGESVKLKEIEKPSMSKNENIIEISFEENGENNCIDDDDDVFARLVSGDPVTIFSADDTPSKKRSSDSFSDSDWEEGIIEGKGTGLSNDVATENKPAHIVKEGNISDESEVEWEEGPSGPPKSSTSCPAESGKAVPRGHLEEETNLQEAIRRSLLDLRGEKSDNFSSQYEKSVDFGEDAYDGLELFDEKSNMGGPNVAGEVATQQVEPIFDVDEELGKTGTVGGVSNSQDLDSLDSQLKLSVDLDPVDLDPDKKVILISKSCEKCLSPHPEQSRQGESEESSLYRDAPSVESVASFELKELHFLKEKCVDDSKGLDRLSTCTKRCAEENSHSSDIVSGGNMSTTILVDGEKNHSEADLSALINEKERKHEVEPSSMINNKKKDCEAEPSCQKIVTSDPSSSVVESCQNELNHGFSGREHSIEKSEIKENENTQVDFTEASLEDEMLILDQECMDLEDQQRKLERNSESVSSEMFAECQELLQMFGLPYIIAPMEAEAQCAYMELANLVDGVVTDDSDVFLFGGRSVYKNIFDDRKYVETYFMQDIEKELGLTREKLIRMALLLGSDYTEGISGIGIVNAIEVVNAFPEEDGLHKFREWIESPDPNILGKVDVQTGSNGRKRGSKVGDNDMNHANNMEGLSEHGQKMKKIFMDNHRNVSKNWHIPSTFPSEAVISAYTSPQVDKSTEPFSWGKPDLFVLRKFCWDKFAWGSQKSDELLLPVLKEYEKRETQLRLEAFYTFNERFAKIRSKRIKKAVKAITGNRSSELTGEAKHEVPKRRKKRRVDGLESGNSRSEKASEGSVAGSQNMKSTPKQFRKRKVPEKSVSSKTGNLEQSITADDQQNANKVSCGNERGRDQRVGKGRGRQKLCAEPLGTSSCDGAGGNNEQEFHAKKLEGPQKVQMSRRSRKPVNYSVSDPEIDDNVEAVEQDRNLGKCGDAAAGPSGKEKLIAGDTLPEGISGDYLVRGGGFCTEEDETGQASARQNEDPFSEAQSSKDYMQMGGGFCVGESDKCEDSDAAKSQLS